MLVVAQVSLYPIEAKDADGVINSSLDELAGQGLDYAVGPVSTNLHGEVADVFAALQRLFEQACSNGGEVSLVATVSNAEM